MRVTLGTFNVNNLFSRYNFQGEIEAVAADDTEVEEEVLYRFTDRDIYRLRSFRGRLVERKEPREQARIAERIKAMNLDLLALQEVEDIDTLKRFNHDDLGGLYPHYLLIEGNDPRLIDVALLSKLPVEAVSTWHQLRHPEDPDQPVFSRDLLQAEIWDERRRRKLLTLFNTHLKSQFVDFREDPVAGRLANDARRRRQAETVVRVIERETRPDSSYVLLGDMNDRPDAAPLAAFAGHGLVNALAEPEETQPYAGNEPPGHAAWTHRYKPAGLPAEYGLYDQIWLSPSLAPKQDGAWIGRRGNTGGEGSDHDPAWIALEL